MCVCGGKEFFLRVPMSSSWNSILFCLQARTEKNTEDGGTVVMIEEESKKKECSIELSVMFDVYIYFCVYKLVPFLSILKVSKMW